MIELSAIMTVLKIYGPVGAIVAGLLFVLVKVVTRKLDRAEKERDARIAAQISAKRVDDDERAKLFAMLQVQNQETLSIMKSELAVQQKTNAQAFALLDRNTSALEKVVEKMDDISHIKTAVDEIKGSLNRH